MAKTILITGGGEGLGRVLALRFAAEGDRVVVLGRTLAKVQAVADELGEPHFAVRCDVGDAASVREAFAEIAAKCPKIDVLINNAASYDPFTLAEVNDEKIVQMVNTNLTGPVLCSRAALPLFQNSGLIINVSSESVRVKFAMQWLYTATKAGLESVSELLDRELAPDGVRVSLIRCGQMYDETKGGTNWPMDLAVRFATANAKVGVDFRNRPLSHYRSVAQVFRNVIDTPRDLHISHIDINGDRPYAPPAAPEA